MLSNIQTFQDKLLNFLLNSSNKAKSVLFNNYKLPLDIHNLLIRVSLLFKFLTSRDLSNVRIKYLIKLFVF